MKIFSTEIKFLQPLHYKSKLWIDFAQIYICAFYFIVAYVQVRINIKKVIRKLLIITVWGVSRHF